MSGKTHHLPRVWLFAAVALACLLLATATAGAATHSFSAVRKHRTTLVFKLQGVDALSVQAARIIARRYRRALAVERVRRAAERGTLRVRVPRRVARRARRSGARSSRSGAPRLIVTTAEATAAAATTSFSPVADTYVDSSHRNQSYGSATGLRIDGSPSRDGYLRFDVRGLPGPVIRATLKLYARNSSTTGLTLHGVSDNGWEERTTTRASAPAIGARVSSSGSFRSGSYASLDATPLVKAGLVSMALKTPSANSKTVESREGAHKPQLVVETGASGLPTGPLPPPPPVSAPPPPAGTDLQPAFPIRGIFYYPWFPETWTKNGDPFTKYQPSSGLYDSGSTSVIQRHVRAMEYGRMEVGISSWWGPGHRTDSRFSTILSATNSMASRFRWALYHENESVGNPSVSTLASDLAYIRDRYASDRAYFRVNGRFVVFVYTDGSDGCAMADRWRQANAGINAYIVLKVFSGYRVCFSQPDGWHQYGPAVPADSQSGYSYSISPGFHHAEESAPRLQRDLSRWNQNVRDMIASNAPFQLVVSLNEWGEGTAVESAEEWASASGYGSYLDALNREGQTVSSPTPSPDPAPAPSNEAPRASFSVSVNPALTGQSVSFDATASSDSDGSIAGYRWDLDGNGTFETDSGSRPTTSRTYSVAGAVAVKLRVTDNDGATADATRSLTVDVQPPPQPEPPSGDDPVIAAAGDISCDPSSGHYNGGSGTANACHQRHTSDLLVNAGLDAVLTLGDNQYESGTLDRFRQAYDPSWGRVKAITRPAVGNHEYNVSGAAGYFDYFNGVGNATGPAGDRSKGYYSFDLGAWHLIALNSNCSRVSCSAGSAQEQWLRSDLAANPAKCTLAYWHHPRFSSGPHGGTSGMRAIWQALYDDGADLVLSGHDHDYERFAPQDPDGRADQARGMREFVVGSGGKNHYSFATTQPNSEVRNSDTYGVLKLTLRPEAYDWRFVPEAGKSFSDSGSRACH